MRKQDFAEKETDKLLDELEKKIVKIYSQASKEIKEKFEKHVESFAKKDEIMFQKWKDGKIEKDDYLKWREGQLFTEKRFTQMYEELSDDLVNADKIAMSVANGYMPEAYALNFNYETYNMEQTTQLNTSFTLYSRETVEKLEKGGRKLLPKRKVDIPKDKIWNMKHLRNEITQGVLQGKSIPDIAKSLRQITDMDRRAAIRNARTMMTGAQNGGRLDAMKRAKDLGIRVQKEWMATLDSRTRDSHADLDGKRVALDSYFPNGCQCPGDPNGRPEEVYNCRCTMVSFYPDYADIIDKRITYNEWAEMRRSEAKNESDEEIAIKEEPKFQYNHRQWIDKIYNSNYSEDDLNEISEAYANAPEELQRLYEKYADNFLPMEDIESGGYFWTADGKVHFNSKKDKEGTDLHARFGTSSHEIGHNIDWLANKKKENVFLSNSYQDKEGNFFKDIIYKDWEDYFIKRKKQMLYDDGSVKVFTEYNDVFSKTVGRGTKKAKNFIQELIMRARIKEAKKEFADYAEKISSRDKIDIVETKFLRLNWQGAKLSDYKQFYSDNRDFFEDYAPKRCVTIDKKLLEDFCKDMRQEHSLQERGDLSDMFERFCIEHGGEAYPFGAGHGEAYAFKDGALEKEAFAEMTSSTLVNEGSLELIKQFLPNAYSAYIEMMKEAVDEN